MKLPFNVSRSKDGYVISNGGVQLEIVPMRKEWNYLLKARDCATTKDFEAPRKLERYNYNFLYPLKRIPLGDLQLWAPKQPHEWLWRSRPTHLESVEYMRTAKTPTNRIKLDRKHGFPITTGRFKSKRPQPVQTELYLPRG